jgi:hypothetical protein
VRNETPQEILCTNCDTVLGTVTMQAVDVVNRPGVFINVCVPNPMPKRCITCDGVITRKPEGYVSHRKRP